MANFKKIELNINRGNGYGQYYIFGNYKGKTIEAHTTNSECFDWLNDDSNKQKHKEAKQYAYRMIVENYKNL